MAASSEPLSAWPPRWQFQALLCLLLGSHSRCVDMSDSFDYSSPTYWDKRYAKQEGTFEWYGVKWPVLEKILQPYVQPESRLLHIGTGNSKLPEDMYHAGFHNQVAADISETVITKMTAKLGHLAPGLEFRVEDALRSSFEAESFDAVFEKGTLEALAADRDCGLFEPGCQMLAGEKGCVLEAFRVLRPGGIFVSVTDELERFKELESAGLERMETIALTEKEHGIPIPKTLYLCFKSKVSKATQRDEM